MAWNFTNNRPIWLQLTEYLTLQIVSGQYELGSSLPSVRALAAEAGVNPNTVQRAMSELESEGLIETRRTAGRIVTEDIELITQMRDKLALERINEFINSMKALGYTEKDIKNMSFFKENS